MMIGIPNTQILSGKPSSLLERFFNSDEIVNPIEIEIEIRNTIASEIREARRLIERGTEIEKDKYFIENDIIPGRGLEVDFTPYDSCLREIYNFFASLETEKYHLILYTTNLGGIVKNLWVANAYSLDCYIVLGRDLLFGIGGNEDVKEQPQDLYISLIRHSADKTQLPDGRTIPKGLAYVPDKSNVASISLENGLSLQPQLKYSGQDKTLIDRIRQEQPDLYKDFRKIDLSQVKLH